MSLQDPIADMLTHIRNGQMARKAVVVIPASQKKINILRVLKQEGYIASFEVNTAVKPHIAVHLKYFNKGKPVIEKIKRVSRPGLRVYARKGRLPKVMGGLGIAILSTSQGVITDKEAARLGQGGEVVCLVA
jgi:small subunit ribosomal protein S8